MSRRAFLVAVRAAACLAVTACQPASYELAVDLRADLAPGIEFDEVVVTLDDAAPVRSSVGLGSSFASSPRIAEYEGVAAGAHDLVVALNRERRFVAGTAMRIQLDRAALVRSVVTRTCRDVRCPGADPRATACFGGRCVDPSCDPEALASTMPSDASARADAGPIADACGPDECATSAECTDTHSPPTCVTPICQRGACLYLPDSTRCGPDQYCDPGTDTCIDIVPTPTVDAIADSSTSVTVSWEAIASADQYVIELSTSADLAGATSITVDAATLSSTFTGLAQGQRHYARVRALAGGATSPWSTTVSAVTAVDTPAAPGVQVSITGSARNVADGDWIYHDTPGSQFYYADVVADGGGGCPAGTHPEYRYRAQYTGTTAVYGPTDWWPAHVYVEQPRSGYGIRIWASMRCVGPDAGSAASGEGFQCRMNSGALC